MVEERRDISREIESSGVRATDELVESVFFQSAVSNRKTAVDGIRSAIYKEQEKEQLYEDCDLEQEEL